MISDPAEHVDAGEVRGVGEVLDDRVQVLLQRARLHSHHGRLRHGSKITALVDEELYGYGDE